MKNPPILAACLALACLTGISFAQDAVPPAPPPVRELAFEWDPQPAEGFIVQVREGLNEWRDVGESDTNSFTGNFPVGTIQVAVIAFNRVLSEDAADAGRILSGRSKWVLVPPDPPTPGFPRLKVTIHIETSDNLVRWREIGRHIIPDEGEPGLQFVRTFTR